MAQLKLFKFLLIWILAAHQCLAQSAIDILNNPIVDPAISKRCKSLLEKRREKLLIKQSLQGLLVRNKRLQKISPKNKKKIKRDLVANQHRVAKELKLAKMSIQNLEENIILKGCPGINL